MRSSRFDVRFSMEPWGLFLLCLVLLLVPVSWLLAWIISAGVHELGHLLMARLLSVPVWGMTVGPAGAKIETAPMEYHQELLCAAAGPLAGCLLILAGRWFPLVAVFAFFHTVWNLLPVGDLDGARVVRCLWSLVRKIPCKPGEERVQ